MLSSSFTDRPKPKVLQFVEIIPLKKFCTEIFSRGNTLNFFTSLPQPSKQN